MEHSHGTTNATPRVIFDDISIDDFNGLIICDRPVPNELLSEIFCHIDDVKTLVNCQLVCKHWRMMIQSYIWRKKAKLVLGKSFPHCMKIPWHVYYLIYKHAFERIQYHSTCSNHYRDWAMKYWQLSCKEKIIGRYYIYEAEENSCSIKYEDLSGHLRLIIPISYFIDKEIINLMNEFDLNVLDEKSPITIREWLYSSHTDKPKQYECSVKLLGVNENVKIRVSKVNKDSSTSFEFCETIKGNNEWLYHSYIFKDYECDPRNIHFSYHIKDVPVNRKMENAESTTYYYINLQVISIKMPSLTIDDESDTNNKEHHEKS